MTTPEMLGFIAGATCVWLAVRESVWNWPVAIANDCLFFIVFCNSKLYADAGLQVVYAILAVYGWWAWLRGGEQHCGVQINRLRPRSALLLGIATLAATAILMAILRGYTDSDVAFWDASTTALSLCAQFMLSRKILENWLVWIAVDVVYIGLYCYKSLYLTAVLYTIFIAMCVAGWVRWRKSLATSKASKILSATARDVG